jgi:saccharopine dehydrogenase-like NADP-dependent oxidoreductase
MRTSGGAGGSKRILVLGSGLSVGPLASYFHERGYRVHVGCRRPERGRALAGGALDAEVTRLDLDDPGTRLAALASEHDLVASFVPGSYQPLVAEACLAARTPLVVSCHGHYFDGFPGGQSALDERARRAGIAIITELGVDCGYLGMLAKRQIDRLADGGRRIRSISFHTGVIPADRRNPFDYAFFWAAKKAALSYVSPRKGKADWIREGARVSVDKHDVYAAPALVTIPGAGALETHPNLDSGAWQYEHTYGVEGIDHFYHGTLRHPGWCETLAAIVALGPSARSSRRSAGAGGTRERARRPGSRGTRTTRPCSGSNGWGSSATGPRGQP